MKSAPASSIKDSPHVQGNASARKDSVQRNASARKDSLRSSKQIARVRFTGQPCFLVKSFKNSKLVLDFCSKCTDICVRVLRGLKSPEGGGMQINTKHGTNFIWTCNNCWEDDQCSALDLI